MTDTKAPYLDPLRVAANASVASAIVCFSQWSAIFRAMISEIARRSRTSFPQLMQHNNLPIRRLSALIFLIIELLGLMHAIFLVIHGIVNVNDG